MFRALADKMNRAAEVVKKAGMQFCYHHHAFEFAPVEGSKTGMDILLERLDPKLAALEVDMFWLKIAGIDPAAFLTKHKGRVPLLHVKDVLPAHRYSSRKGCHPLHSKRSARARWTSRRF